MKAPQVIETVEQLDELLSEPSEPVVEALRRLEGDVLLLGVSGKIGPSLARLARRGSDRAGAGRRIIGVARFSSSGVEAKLRQQGIETIRCDLLAEGALDTLPEAPNVIFLAGMKFGSNGQEAQTWAVNTYLPALVCRRFRRSRLLAFSTGTAYGLAEVAGPGSREEDAPNPVGEYAMSCLGRERMIEHFSRALGLPAVLLRLNYACELRYGVLVDIARKVHACEVIDLTMGYFNIIWQGDANAMALCSLPHASTPPLILNLTGSERLSVRQVALEFGEALGREPRFTGVEAPTAILSDAGRARRLFGPPTVPAAQLIGWVADWVRRGGASLGKPTHFEVRDGKF